jgi:glycosyltransferase involved in cell wall biosynthesis
MNSTPLQRWLFLRSAHAGAALELPPPDQNIKKNEDMWTHFFHTIVRRCRGEGRILRIGRSCQVNFSGCNGTLSEWRGADFRLTPDFSPDVIFNRGGYGKYLGILQKNPNALKIYYGAGCRWQPADGIFYDLILTDTVEQLLAVRQSHPQASSGLIIKPAAENIFKPVECDKEFDVVFISHTPKEFKGHAWLAAKLPRGVRVLRIGQPDPWFTLARDAGQLDVTFTGLVPREKIPSLACRAKFGVVADDGRWDSGPRIVAELLAMNLPILVRNTVRVHPDRYVTDQTGLLADDNDFSFQFARMMTAWQTFRPREHYDRYCSLPVAARRLLQLASLAARVRARRCTQEACV